MNRIVLVLSATGTTGSLTVRALLRRGADVRAATRDPSTARFPEGVTPVRFDLDAPDTWPAALDGVDAVYLATAAFRPDEVEVVGRLLEVVRAAGVQKVVRLSALGANQDPNDAHARVEALVQASGMDWIVLQPTFFQDNFITHYGQAIASDGVIPLPAGKGRIGFVAASDIAEMAAEALLGEATGQSWPLTGPESLNHEEVAAVLTEVLGRPIRYVDVPPEAFEAAMAAQGAPPLAVATMSRLYGLVRAGYTDGTVDTVREVLGRPPVALRDWARAHADAWRA